ncbi:hypothetical protein ACFYVL_31785 [Streptomyces sp. NPDC004111]|uniref:hypothetical protein n=1 Tax=Streptomyces sp. NPDC004111 TaxID=3364690 RepID=UPI0036BFE476
MKTASALGYLCENLEEIQNDNDSVSEPLSRLLPLLRANARQLGTPSPDDRQHIADLLNAIHEALQAGEDALGLFGHAMRSPVDAVGVDSLDVVYRCPLALCTGRLEREITGALPRCSVNGAELRREHLA